MRTRSSVVVRVRGRGRFTRGHLQFNALARKKLRTDLYSIYDFTQEFIAPKDVARYFRSRYNRIQVFILSDVHPMRN